MDLALVLLLKYKYLILLPITIFEGPTISIIAGAFIATGYLNPFTVYGIVILGDIIGDTLYYCIGRFGGLYSKWGRFLKIDDKKIMIIEKMFTDDGPKILFLGKAQGLGAIVLIAGGLVKYPYKLFMLYNIIATLLKSLILILIGFYFGKEYAVANNYITKIGIFLSFAFLAIAYFYMRKKFKLEK
jgi:membrane protein DedA with SNARE-associated domain